MIKLGTIYMLTCIPTEMSYIGQTIRKLQKRLREHQCKGNTNRRISNAIHHYGWTSFKVDILHKDVPQSNLDWLERHSIWIFNTLSPNGYNLQEGGNNGFKTEDYKIQVRKEYNPRFGEDNPRYRKDLRKKKEEIIKKYLDGKSLSDLGRDYNCSLTAIKKVLIENEIEIRSNKKPEIQSDKDNIIKLYQSGLSTVKIANLYDCSDVTIGKILKKSGSSLKDLRLQK